MTFSLLGRCPATGQLGAAVTTSDLAVGARVPHARAGLGVAVTQSRTDPRLGPRLLDALGAGHDPRAAVAATANSTRHRTWRQLGVLDATGASASFAGELVAPHVGALPGANCLAVGNMLTGEQIAPAMVAAFTATGGPLALRLLAALHAGQDAGGERGQLRSAALLVVERESFPLVDLRIDAASDPLSALDALWREYEPWTRDFAERALDPDEARGRPAHDPSSTTR